MMRHIGLLTFLVPCSLLSQPIDWVTDIKNKPLSPLSVSSTYSATVANFQQCRTIVVPSGTFPITLVPAGSQPARAQCLDVINFGSGIVTVQRNGQSINGGVAPVPIPAGSAASPAYAHIVSDGANYFMGVSSTALPVPLTLSRNAGSPSIPAGVTANGNLFLLGADNSSPGSGVFSYGTGFGSTQFFRARGTGVSPSAVQVLDVLGGVSASAYGATGFNATPAGCYFVLVENPQATDTASGTRFDCWVIKDGTTTPLNSLTLEHDGSIKMVSMSSPGTPPAGFARQYVDATSKNAAVKNDAGTINHMVQTQSCPGGQAAVGINDDGTVSCAAFSGGGGAASALTDFSIARTSSSLVTLTTPTGGSNVSFGPVVRTFASGTATISLGAGSCAASGLMWLGAKSDGSLQLDANSSVTFSNVTVSGITKVSNSATTNPPDLKALYKIACGNNAVPTAADHFDVAPFTDFRAFLSMRNIGGGTYVIATEDALGKVTVDLDPTKATNLITQTCVIRFGKDNGSALVTGDIQPQKSDCQAAVPSTVNVIIVKANAGASTVQLGYRHSTGGSPSTTSYTSAVMTPTTVTNVTDKVVCANAGGTSITIDGVSVTCGTLATQVWNAGDSIETVGGAADATTARLVIFVQYSVN